jgi:heme exporter protein D
MHLGPYAPFILSAYGAAAAIVACLIVWVVLDRRQLRRMFEQAEMNGMSRRSARDPETYL